MAPFNSIWIRQLLQRNLWFVLAVLLLTEACKKSRETVAPTDDNEASTTATLTSQTTPVQTVTATVEGLNSTADLSRAPLNLQADTTYTGDGTLLDKTKMPTHRVSAVVKEKANEHLLVYTYTPATGSPTSPA